MGDDCVSASSRRTCATVSAGYGDLPMESWPNGINCFPKFSIDACVVPAVVTEQTILDGRAIFVKLSGCASPRTRLA